MGILCWSLVEETPRCLRLSLLSAWQLLLLVSQKLRLMLTLTCSMVDMDWDMLDTTIPPMDMDILVTMERGLLMLSPRLMLILIFSMVDITDSDMLDTTTLPMAMLPTMARDLLMLSPKLMLILIFSMEDTTESDMLDTIILPTDMLLIMARDLLMLNPMCIVDTMGLVDTVVSVDMDLDVVSTMDKQRISPH